MDNILNLIYAKELNGKQACVLEHKDYFLAVVIKGDVWAKKFSNHTNNLQQAVKWALTVLESDL